MGRGFSRRMVYESPGYNRGLETDRLFLLTRGLVSESSSLNARIMYRSKAFPALSSASACIFCALDTFVFYMVRKAPICNDLAIFQALHFDEHRQPFCETLQMLVAAALPASGSQD